MTKGNIATIRAACDRLGVYTRLAQDIIYVRDRGDRTWVIGACQGALAIEELSDYEEQAITRHYDLTLKELVGLMESMWT